jgi:hypothetical protein
MVDLAGFGSVARRAVFVAEHLAFLQKKPEDIQPAQVQQMVRATMLELLGLIDLLGDAGTEVLFLGEEGAENG